MSEAQKAKHLATSHQAPLPAVSDESAAILQVIERAAMNPAVDIDKMERLLAMQERIVARNAKAAYTDALSSMQLELPEIVERGKIQIGTGKAQMYARWEDINEGIKPTLAKHGFALSFRTGRDGDKIVVTGVLSHRDGHSEETTIHLPSDTSGSKNAVQAVGSSTSYGKRYTASALLNLTSRGEDDDGLAAGAKPISEEQLSQLVALADEVGADKAKFCGFMKVEALAEIAAKDFDRAVMALNSKRKKK